MKCPRCRIALVVDPDVAAKKARAVISIRDGYECGRCQYVGLRYGYVDGSVPSRGKCHCRSKVVLPAAVQVAECRECGRAYQPPMKVVFAYKDTITWNPPSYGPVEDQSRFFTKSAAGTTDAQVCACGTVNVMPDGGGGG